MKDIENMPKTLPTLHPIFAPFIQSGALAEHVQKGGEILKRILPEEFFAFSSQESDDWLAKNLPLIKWDELSSVPDGVSIYILCSPTHEVQAEKVLPDLIRRWLIPEKEVHILAFHNLYFHMKDTSSRLFFIAEIKILVEDGRDWGTIQSHLPLLTNEISLSLSSARYLEHVLDTKALSLDQKSSQIQYYLRKLISRVPDKFDIDLFKEMSVFFALSKLDFRKFRQSKHLARLVVTHNLLHRNLLQNLSISPEKRHLDFRFIRSKLHFPFGTKDVLGLSIAVSLADRYEDFGERHIIRAIQKFIPTSRSVKGSYYSLRATGDPVKTIYLELEKIDGSLVNQIELALLKKELKEELKKRIEKLMPSVFMIRNEEEVMRNILILSQELKYLSDIPQVMVNFEKQTQDELHFTVLLVRMLKKHDLPLEKAFEKVGKTFKFISDRLQNVGYVRKKNPKEANVFHLVLPKGMVLRTDSSVNFYLARQQVISILTEALGDVRDYNGGMILKQGELFAKLKDAFGGIADKNQELLENFFFALTPIEAQATSSLSTLKSFFHLFLKISAHEVTKRDPYFHMTKKKNNIVLSVMRAKDRSFEPIISEELSQLENFSKSLIQTQVNFQGTLILGFIYESPTQSQQREFQRCIDQGIKKWLGKVRNQQELRLSFPDLSPSLDPRLGGDDMTSTINRMLFEGLTRISKGGTSPLAIARSIEISSDQKRYTFRLRPSYWSDGSPLLAFDFEYAWKKILSPTFYTPFSYVFYPINNAREAKEGKIGLEKVGVKAIDDLTLIVDLENPSPEFLELTAHALYSPINHKVDALHPNWAQSGEDFFVGNGPFVLKRTLPNGGHEFVRNPKYWDKESVKLDRILITKSNAETALEMYKKDEIDWMGYPMRPWEPYFDLSGETKLESDLTGLVWCVLNTQRFPFDHLKMRQAFFYATDTIMLLKGVPGIQDPPLSPLPQIHSRVSDKNLARGDKKLAITLFEEALKEMGLDRNSFPVLTLSFTGGPTRRIIVKRLIQQWEKIFEISCHFEEYDFHTLFPKLIKGEYQVGSLSWKAWINDPMYTLGIFEFKNNRVNFPKWEHPHFQQLLAAAKKEVILEKRQNYYKQAEELLIHECPIIPLQSTSFFSMHKTSLRGVLSSELGNVDFREAFIVPN